MTIKQLLSNMDADELSWWMIYYKLKNEKKEDSDKVISAKIQSGFPMHGKRR